MAGKLDAMKPQRKIELFSGSYFAACTMGGIIACGPTHTMVTPLDLVSRMLSQRANDGLETLQAVNWVFTC